MLFITTSYPSRLETFLPDGFDAVAEIVEDMATLDATACREEATDNTSDVAGDVEILGIVDANALHSKAETAYAWKNDGLSFGQTLFQDILKLSYDTSDGAL